MKIAVCLKVIQPRDGTSHFALQLGRALASSGHAVTMIAEKLTGINLQEYSPGLGFVNISQSSWESVSGHVKRIARIIQKQDFQIVFICAGMPVIHLEDALCLLPDGVYVVPVVGGHRDHVYDPMRRSAAAWNVAVAESPRLQDAIKERMPEKPVRLLTTGIDHPSETELNARQSLSSPLRLLFVGRMFGRKNVWMLPKILSACLRKGLSATLTICGNGPDRTNLEQACHAEGVAHLVTFPNVPLQADLYRFYRSHHVSLLTSSEGEGLGLVLLEAQANGCVPVASRLPGVTDFSIQEGVTGLLAEVENPDSFADQIISLADPDRWQSFSQAGIERTQRLFTLDAMAHEYEELINDLQQGAYNLHVPRSRLSRPDFRLSAYLPRAFFLLIQKLVHLMPGR